MHDVEYLQKYANAEATLMDLCTPVKITVCGSLDFSGMHSLQRGVHEIVLTEPDINTLRHELGHAYITEKHPRLQNFFICAGLPFRASRSFGQLLMWAYITATAFVPAIVGALLGNIFLQCLPAINAPWIVEEWAASYLGRKYSPV